MRFPEFNGEWEVKKLGEVASKINSGKTPLGGDAVYTNKGILFIRSQNVNNDKLELENPVFIPEEINKGMRNSMVHPNDILLNITGASLGRSCVVPEEFNIGNVNQHVCIIRTNVGYNPRFIQPILSSTKGQNIFKSLQTGSGREGLNFESIKNIQINFPTLPEQQKISTFLSLIDKKISTQSKIIEDLKVLKNSISKKMFTQQLRFKDENGNDFPDWEIKKVKEIFDITRGSVLSMTLVSQKSDNIYIYPVYSSQTKNNGLSGYFHNFLFENCITWTTDGAGAGDVNFRKGKFYCTNVCGVLKNDQGYANLFIAEILNSISRKHVSYVGNPKLMNNVMSEILINIPESIAEQTKISNFLSSINEKIEVENLLLNQLQTQKKYLLSNLFI